VRWRVVRHASWTSREHNCSKVWRFESRHHGRDASQLRIMCDLLEHKQPDDSECSECARLRELVADCITRIIELHKRELLTVRRCEADVLQHGPEINAAELEKFKAARALELHLKVHQQAP
jgi:hypothetical protein